MTASTSANMMRRRTVMAGKENTGAANISADSLSMGHMSAKKCSTRSMAAIEITNSFQVNKVGMRKNKARV